MENEILYTLRPCSQGGWNLSIMVPQNNTINSFDSGGVVRNNIRFEKAKAELDFFKSQGYSLKKI